jgi:SOS-response transcriptional repressor LexA
MRELNETERAIVFCIKEAIRDNRYTPSRETLSRASGWGIQTTSRHLNRLAKEGVIKIKRNSGGNYRQLGVEMAGQVRWTRDPFGRREGNKPGDFGDGPIARMNTNGYPTNRAQKYIDDVFSGRLTEAEAQRLAE